MKHTYTVSVWTGQYMNTHVLTHIKITAVDLKTALDKAEAKVRALNSSQGVDACPKADYLLCGGFMRLVA